MTDEFRSTVGVNENLKGSLNVLLSHLLDIGENEKCEKAVLETVMLFCMTIARSKHMNFNGIEIE